MPIPRAAPTLVSGYRAQEDQATNRVKLDVLDQILRWEPGAAPLTLLTSAVRGMRTVHRHDFDWHEEDPYPLEATMAAEESAAAVTLDVTTGQGARFKAGDLLQVDLTREVVLVTAVSTDALTCARSIGEVPAQIIEAGAKVRRIGYAFEDGADVGTLKSVVQNREFNYCQIFRNAFGWTGRDLVLDMYGGRDPSSTRQSKAIEHKQAIEFSGFFGARHTMTGTKTRTMTGGAEFFIKSNVIDYSGGTLNERAFVESLEYTMKYGKGGNVGGGSSKKYLFASRRWLTEIEMWAKGKLQTQVLSSRYGLTVKSYQSTHGDVVLVPQNIFQGENASYAFLLDMNHIRKVKVRERDTSLLTDRQGNGIDGKIEEYRTDCGWQFEIEGAHALYKGISV